MRAPLLPSRSLAALAASLALALGACGGDGDGDDGNTLGIADDCNPLGGAHCMTPWPSSAFEADDVATATGRRLHATPR